MKTTKQSLLGRADRTFIIAEVQKLYGGTIIELNYETPFQLLVAVMLSAQTTDKQVNRITPPLFRMVREASEMAELTIDELENHIRYVNFYHNKARHIIATAQRLASEFDGIIPNDLKLLQTFPGIGVKTAKVVLSVLYDEPLVGVDTHIHRVMNRLGIVRSKTPNETDKEIDRIFTLEEKQRLHHPFVLFGRYMCVARKPKCASCPLREVCRAWKTEFSEVTSIKKIWTRRKSASQ